MKKPGNHGNTLICLVGTFPPPLHGMSQVNKYFRELLEEKTKNIRVYDTASKILFSSVLTRALRGLRAARLLLFFAIALSRRKQVTRVYIGLSGGIGQVLDCLFLVVSRTLGAKPWIHHHSFAYINRYSTLTQLVIRIAGQNATHIVLCDRMAKELSTKYSPAMKTLVLSNAALIGAHPNVRSARTTRPLCVGFLSNVALSKGIDLFVAVAQHFAGRDDINFVIAGPIVDHAGKGIINTALRTITNMAYVGGIYGADKLDFLKRIDVLLFPSKYINEAEPLSVLEAMSSAVAIVATDRGCIRHIVPLNGGVLISETDFVRVAIETLEGWIKSSAKLVEAQGNAMRAFDHLAKLNQTTAEKLISQLISPLNSQNV